MSKLIAPLSFRTLLLILLLPTAFVSTVLGQATAARPDRGGSSTSSYSVSDIEKINLTNGNLNLTIPLASLPPIAGGKLKLTLNAVYNSKLWDVTREEGQMPPLAGCPSWVVNKPQLSERGGWHIDAGYEIIFREAQLEDFHYVKPDPPGPGFQCEQNIQEQILLQHRWYRTILIAPDGGEHELRPTDSSASYDGIRDYLRNYYKDTPTTLNAPMRYYSFDGTFLSATINPSGSSTEWTIYLNDGTKVTKTNDGIQRISDANGNSIKIFGDSSGTHYQDEQTGREIRVTTDVAGNGQVLYQTVSGIWESININYGTTLVQGKLYQVEGWNPIGGETGGGMPCIHDNNLQAEFPVIRQIVFPATEPGIAGKHFEFAYNSDTTNTATDEVRWVCGSAPETYARTVSKGMGSLSQIITPSGSVVNYSYSRDNTHRYPLDTDGIARETITQKQVTHDGTTDSWSYAVLETGDCEGTVTAPDGSVTTDTCYAHDPAGSMYFGSGSLGKGGLVFRSNNSGKVVVERHWTLMPFSGANTGPTGASQGFVTFNPIVDAEYTSLLDGNGNVAKMAAKTYQYDYNGNLLSETDYDWFENPSLVTRDTQGVPTGVPAGATVLRVVNSTYYNPASSADSPNVYAKRPLATAAPVILNALRESTIGPSITRLSYDEQPYDTSPTIGNLTSQSTWDDIDNKWITSSQTYGPYGNVSTRKDANEKVTRFFFDDAAHAQPNRVVVDPQNGTGQQTSTTVLDFSTGAVISQTDPNGNVSSVDYTNQLLGTVDPFGRQGVAFGPWINSGDVSQRHSTTTTYFDSALRVVTASDLYSENDSLLKTRTTNDMLGRTILTEQTEDGTNYTIYSRNAYSRMGKVSYASSPLRYNVSSSSDNWTRAKADTLGRMDEVATFGGSSQPPAPSSSPCPANGAEPNFSGKVCSTYDANHTTVKDQADKSRSSEVDALGRLVKVIEDPNDRAYETTYGYDVLGNLTTVTQGQQTRTFTYDSLSRLRSAMNPESGTVTYTYDDNGNLKTRTDARLVVSHYDYDALNRNTSVAYTNDPANTPTVTRTYDGAINGKGGLWKSETSGNDASSTVIDSYDALGRPTSQSQRFYNSDLSQWSAPFTVTRDYNLSGGVLRQTYPSGHFVNYTYDQAGRLNYFNGNLGYGETRPYATAFQYDAAGRMLQEQYGTLTPLYHKQHFNARGQLYDVRLSSQSLQTSAFDGDRGALVYYYSSQNFTTPGYTGSNNNGNVIRSEVYIPGGGFFQDNYEYDSLNRLTSVAENQNGQTTALFAQGFTYDRFGNRTINQATTSNAGINNLAMSIDPANNRLLTVGQSAVSYDPSGNLLQDGHTFDAHKTPVYDAENRMSRINRHIPQSFLPPFLYVYDANGQRVRRSELSGSHVYEKWQVYGMDGELLAEYQGRVYNAFGPTSIHQPSALPFLPEKEYGYRNGQLLITASGGDAKRIDRFITNFYFGALGRPPSATELLEQRNLFLAAAGQGQSALLAVAQDLGRELFDLENSNSEYNGRGRDDLQFQADLCFAYLQRTPDAMAYTFRPDGGGGVSRVSLRDEVGGEYSEFASIISTLYGIDDGATGDRVTRYLSAMYRVGSTGGDFDQDVDKLQGATAEGRTAAIATAKEIGIGIVQGWLDNEEETSDEQLAAALFHVFLQREASESEVGDWAETIHNNGRSAALQSFADLPATEQLAGTLYREILWLTPDQLGTPRMISERSGSLSGIKRHDYLPFGEELFTAARTPAMGYAAGDDVRQQFTQKERDNETGLDYLTNRYYSSTQGRFTSVDPENAGAFEDEPQSWNGYAYVGNMPLIATDPLGLWKQIECNSGNGKCWESDNKSDTITSLAKILHVSPSDLNNFFQNPTIHIGDQFDASGFYRNNTNTIWTNVVQVDLVSEPGKPQDNAAVAAAMTALRLDPEPESKIGGAAAIAFYIWLHSDREVRDYVAPPRNLPAFPDARRVRRRGNRVRWQDDDGNIYEWDYQHGRVEKYDRRGRHLGEFDPETGKQTSPPDPTRRVET